jgi:murein DD-endopeptidase MepM/ murein hydrolase activator NlpD
VSARGWLVLLLVLLVAGGAGLAWIRAEGAAPSVAGPDALLVGAAGSDVQLELSDAGAGLRSIRVALAHAQGEETLFDELLAGSLLTGGAPDTHEQRVSVRIDPEVLGRRGGEAFLRISARDWSWRDGFRGNEARVDIPVTIDLAPPRIAVASGLTYVRRGGAGAVVYSVSEPTVRDGVRVGDRFFPGAPLPGDPSRRAALFAVATDTPRDPPVRVVAVDDAGNESGARWPVVVQERVLPEAAITVPQVFLDTTVSELARAEKIDAPGSIESFQVVNTTLRGANERRIRELVAETADEKLWTGPFAQLYGSKVTSRFAEHRNYFFAGEKISEATHFGYDLAATAAAGVTASNAGTVIFADELGIYGNCVLVDHGLGLTTLYGHLSRVDVAVGDRVTKGQTLGLSGSTGLAGGDHLHFAILVRGVYVDPLEWWDPSWVQTHIDARLAPSAP